MCTGFRLRSTVQNRAITRYALFVVWKLYTCRYATNKQSIFEPHSAPYAFVHTLQKQSLCASFRILRKPVFCLGRLPHFAECCFSSGQTSAWCGTLFFRWASFRILRKAVFRLGKLPHFAESRFFAGRASAVCGKLFQFNVFAMMFLSIRVLFISFLFTKFRVTYKVCNYIWHFFIIFKKISV